MRLINIMLSRQMGSRTSQGAGVSSTPKPRKASAKRSTPINAKRTGTLQAATGAPSANSGLRVVHAVQVGDQGRTGWLPV